MKESSFASLAEKAPSGKESAEPVESDEPVESEHTDISPFSSVEVQTLSTGYEDDRSGRKRYNNDFLMAQRNECRQIPDGIEAATWSALSWDGENGSGRGGGGPPPGKLSVIYRLLRISTRVVPELCISLLSLHFLRRCSRGSRGTR